MTAEYIWGGINDIVSVTDAAFVGKVLEVSSPRWNSNDGCPWAGGRREDNNDAIIPVQFRDVKVQATRVIFDSPELAIAQDGVLTVRFLGDGSPTGDRVTQWTTENNHYGPVVAGETVFLLAYVWKISTENGYEQVASPHYWQGYWRVQGDTAVNVVPLRTVPLEPLIGRVQEERRVGRNPARDRNTIFNPLGDPNAPDGQTP